MELINPLVEEYAAKFTSHDNVLLQQILNNTQQTHTHAHMLSGAVQGKFLSFISQLMKPKYIFEIGSFVGHSALCLAEGLHKKGELHTIELRNEEAETAQKNFSISKYNKQITLHIGNALDIIPTLNCKWDLVFIDADKENYTAYYNLVLPRLNTNGLIIADNVLFHGQVVEEKISGKNAKAIQAFNEQIANDNRVEQVLLTIRDGLLLIKKKC
jgi:predicted O-methyltransferase YrrM